MQEKSCRYLLPFDRNARTWHTDRQTTEWEHLNRFSAMSPKIYCQNGVPELRCSPNPINPLKLDLCKVCDYMNLCCYITVFKPQPQIATWPRTDHVMISTFRVTDSEMTTTVLTTDDWTAGNLQFDSLHVNENDTLYTRCTHDRLVILVTWQ